MKSIVAAVAIMCLGSAAAAQPAPSNPLLDAVVGCKAQTDEQARLRCYDVAVGALATAASSGSVVVVDREDVRKTRRSLFGFSLPKLPFFGGDDSQDDQPDEIEAKIASARGVGYGKWVIELESGARWQTTEANSRMRDPKPGQTVKIKKALMGSYFLTVEGGRTVKAMRVG